MTIPGPLVIAVALGACHGAAETLLDATFADSRVAGDAIDAAWSTPEPVTIQGYSGPAEDPTLSTNGSNLFFDSHTDDPSIPVKLYWATMTDYKTAAFMGEIGGVNQAGKQLLVATTDHDNNFYFTTTFDGPLPTTACGVFANGAVTGIAPVAGMPPPSISGQVATFTQVGEITADGTRLYASEFRVQIGASGPVPLAASAVLYNRQADGSFALGNDATLTSVNALGKLIYGAVESEDGFTLYFTGADLPGTTGRIRLYSASRASSTGPFNTPAEIVTPWPQVEAPWPSLDGAHLYFHHIVSDSDAEVYVMTSTGS